MTPSSVSNIPSSLLSRLHKENVVLWWGWQPRDLETLVSEISSKSGYAGEVDLLNASTHFVSSPDRSRLQLIHLLKELCSSKSSNSLAPLDKYLYLPINWIVTPRVDAQIEQVCRELKKPFTTITRDQEIAYIDPSKLTIINICGSTDQPESLILTEEDHLNFSETHPRIHQQLTLLLSTHTWLFVNAITETNFKKILFSAVLETGNHRRPHYSLNARFDNPYQWSKQGIEPIENTGVDDLLQSFHKFDSKQDPPNQMHSEILKEKHAYRRPYKFLDYFTAEDASLFFGRDEAIKNLSDFVTAFRLTIVCGRSGVGKTSLIRAGVIPEMKSRGFKCFYVRLGQDPEWSVKRVLLRAWEDDSGLPPDPNLSLAEYISRTSKKLLEPIVIFIDQLEEIERLSKAMRRSFAKTISEILSFDPGSVRLIFSIREDFLAVLD